MTDTCDELAQQATHEKRMREDIEYAIEYRKQEVYEDLVNFQEFMDAHQMYDQISHELLRALCNVDSATCGMRGMHAILDALSNIKAEIDAKIEYIERKEWK